MIVRELIAVLGIELDDRDVKKVDTAVSKFEGRMQSVGKAIGGTIFLAGLARAAGAVIGYASDAQETLGLVRETFGEHAAGVEAWSRTVSKEVGRSEFLMREMAGTLGAVLTPALDGNTEASAEMSTKLAALAVDLGSLFNTSESEALEKLRAGLIGSTEPLLAFGVNLQVAELQTFALTQGITKQVQKMTQAEKVTLRYQLILAKTTTAQGDAARTADGFANASRAAADGIKDLATRIGTRLLPVATRFMIWGREAARSLTEVFQKTNLLQSGLIALAGALGIAAIMMLAPFLPFLITAAEVLLVIAAITAVGDELITLFKGGTTVIGEFIDSMKGIGATQVLIDSIKDGWVLMGEAMDDSVLKLAGWAIAADEAMGFAGTAVGNFADSFKVDLAVLGGAFTAFWDDITARFPLFTKVVEAFGRANAKIASAPGDLISAALRGVGKATGLQSLGSDISNAFSADTFNELRTRRTAVGEGIDARSVGARQGSTSARLRLRRTRELEEKRRLTKSDRQSLVRLETKDKGAGDDLSEAERKELSALRSKRSTGRRLKAEQLTKTELLELSRITDAPVDRRQRANVGSATERRRSGAPVARQAVATRRPREFARASAPVSPVAQPAVAPTINASITINEANDTDATRRAVQKGISDAVADAGASLARGMK